MSTKVVLPARLALLRTMGPVIGVGGLAIGAILAMVFGGGVDLFFQATLYSFWLLFGLSLGSLALIMIHHMTAGAWSFISQRIFEAFTRTLVVPAGMFVLIFLGTVFGWHTMFDGWIHPTSHVVESKTMYLNLPFWSARAAFYFSVWFGIAFMFNKWSRDLDREGDALITLKFRKAAPVGLLAYCLTMTFAGVDWGQSLEPEWFSTMYAPLFWISQGLTVFAVTILILSSLSEEKPISKYLTVEHYHTLATLLCGFIVLWAYMSFSQFLIIWAGNLPEEIHYYLDRTSSQLYNVVILVLMVGHFFLPFMVLLQRRIKYNIGTLRAVCWWVIAMRLVDIFFIINPAFHHGTVGAPIGDMVVYAFVLAGYAGIFFWYFLGELTKMPLLALNDPRMHDALDPAQGHGAGEEAMEHV